MGSRGKMDHRTIYGSGAFALKVGKEYGIEEVITL
jgi:hypothetical protein